MLLIDQIKISHNYQLYGSHVSMSHSYGYVISNETKVSMKFKRVGKLSELFLIFCRWTVFSVNCLVSLGLLIERNQNKVKVHKMQDVSRANSNV